MKQWTAIIKYIFFSFIGLVFLSNALAFSAEKCDEALNPSTWQINGFISSTQFTSSFGGCSALGQMDVTRKFIVANEANLKQEMAIGHGEYLSALNEVLACPSEKAMEFNRALQKRTPSLIHLENDGFLREITYTANEVCFDNT